MDGEVLRGDSSRPAQEVDGTVISGAHYRLARAVRVRRRDAGPTKQTLPRLTPIDIRYSLATELYLCREACLRLRAKAHAPLFAKSEREAGHGSESAAVEAALAAWRRIATDVILAAVAAVHLPPVILVALDHGPPMGRLVKAAGLTGYLVIAAAALLRRVERRKRIWGALVAAYLAIAVLNVALPRGPYAQVGMVTLPIFVLVLLGPLAARAAVLACVAIVVAAPLLRSLPSVARTLAIEPTPAGPPAMVWMQAATLAAFLAALVVLLDRFYRFLLDALAAQEREAAERYAAQRKMEEEMRERQRLEHEIASIGEWERRRFGRELHDGVCQQVTAALLRCQALERKLERGASLSGPDLAPLSSLLADTIDDAHDVALGLCPLEPGPDSLAPALRALARRTQEMADVICEFLAAGDVRVPDPAAAQHIYRIAQEALSNAVRHAHASRVALELRGSDGELSLQVEDNGTGLPAELPTGGMGLRTMAYRARIVGGELTLTPAPGGGTRVMCRVPRLAAPPDAPDPSGDRRWIPAT